MSLGLLVIIGLCFAAFKTKPAQISFQTFLQSRIQGSAKKGFFSRLFSSPIPRFKIQDFGLCTLATLENDRGKYLGLFGTWIPLVETIAVEVDEESFAGMPSSSSSSSSSSKQHASMAKAEALKMEGNSLRVRRDISGAAKSYLLAAKVYEASLDDFEKLEGANCYFEAYKCYRQSELTEKAIECLTLAASIYATQGKAARAAKCHESLCEMYEKNQQLPKAITHCKQAIELFNEANHSEYHPLLQKLGEFHAKLANFEESFSVFDKLAKLTLGVSALQFGTKNHFASACFCIIGSQDWRKLSSSLAEYANLDPTFSGTREYTFLRSIMLAKERNQLDEFTNLCKSYDDLSPLTDWKISVLKRMKDTINPDDLL